MPYRKPGTLEVCWYILKLIILDLLGLNEDEETEVKFIPVEEHSNELIVRSEKRKKGKP